jgi:hypothetical protein
LKIVPNKADVVKYFTGVRIENIATHEDFISLGDEIRKTSISLQKWMLFFAILNVLSTYIIFWVFFGKH